MDRLDNGFLLCQLAETLQGRFRQNNGSKVRTELSTATKRSPGRCSGVPKGGRRSHPHLLTHRRIRVVPKSVEQLSVGATGGGAAA